MTGHRHDGSGGLRWLLTYADMITLLLAFFIILYASSRVDGRVVGAGILGFVMTFALTNVWSHGTWITAGHAHLALFGTFGMLGIAAAYYAVPIMRKVPNYDQRLGKLGFWLDRKSTRLNSSHHSIS